jgi:two-component system, chemotaxis family, chemotaxis protein CheY
MEHAGFTILLVDDEPDTREDLSFLLEREGYIVLPAANGQEALDRLRNINCLPSVVLLDLTMPVLDGRGFLAQRARIRTLVTIPVIVVSGSKPDNEILSEVEGFLQKPVEMTRLLEMVRDIEARAR